MSVPSTISKLEQEKFFRWKQSFEIVEDYQLRVSVNSFFKKENWSLPLRILDSNPTRIKRFDLRGLIVVIPMSLLSLVALISAAWAFYYGKFGWGALFMGGAFGAFAVFAIIGMYRKSVNALIFRAANGARLPLWFNNPTQEKFEAFVAALQQSIKEAQSAQPYVLSLSAEIEKLKELFDRGLLDKDQFEAAKNKLTGNTAPRKMGF